jgi:hypothetical protein
MEEIDEPAVKLDHSTVCGHFIDRQIFRDSTMSPFEPGFALSSQHSALSRFGKLKALSLSRGSQLHRTGLAFINA